MLSKFVDVQLVIHKNEGKEDESFYITGLPEIYH